MLSPLATVIVAVEADAPDNPAARAVTRVVAEARATGARIGLLQCGGAPGSGFDAADLMPPASSPPSSMKDAASVLPTERR